MTRIIIFCEGTTEEAFVQRVLYPALAHHGAYLVPIKLRTSREQKGGVSTYGKVKHQIERKCKEEPNSFVTTLIDFYGLPNDFPEQDTAPRSLEGAIAVEKAFEKDVNQKNFIANIVIHEFEGLLFSSPSSFSTWLDTESLVSKFIQIRSSFPTPEHINDGRLTAPSKRILKLWPAYDKVQHGSLLASEIGLDTICSQCVHFRTWVERLKELGEQVKK